MHTLTKTFLTSLALTLAACDAEPAELGDDFGAGATEFRPFGGFSLNTSFLGGHEHSELDLKGKFHKGSTLTKVCMGTVGGKHSEPVCIYPDKDLLWVEKGQIMGQKGATPYKGEDFIGSRWFLKVDYDRDGVIDSTIDTLIVDARANATSTGIEYWDYFWKYDTKTVTGLATKFIKPQEELREMCKPDAETGSLGSVALENTSLDTTPGTKAIVEKVSNSMFIACHSGAAGKAPSLGYVLYNIGHIAYTNALRVIRADYCGTGESFTEPGQKIAITDIYGLSDQYDSEHKLEGLVSFKQGWVCLENPRMADLAEVHGACKIEMCGEKAELGDLDSQIIVQLP